MSPAPAHHIVDAMTYALDVLMPKKVTITANQIACRKCGVSAGDQCLKWVRKRKGKVQVPRRNPHSDRYHDAKIATQAAMALLG